MRIDAHQHFWIYNSARDGWITEEMKVIQKNFLPADAMSVLKENSFDGCIAVQADPSENETQFLLTLAENNSFVKGVVGWVDLCSADVRSRLEYYSQFSQFKGVRHIVQAEPDDFLLRTDFCSGVKILGEFGFTYDLLIYPRQMPEAIAFVEKFPDQKIVIDHLAKPPIKSRQIAEWADNLERLAAGPNVYCKLSGMVTEADWKNWNYEDFVPYLEIATRSFGVDRLLYGSDWPVCLVAAGYKEQLSIIENYFLPFSGRDQRAIFGGNAARFYNIAQS